MSGSYVVHTVMVNSYFAVLKVILINMGGIKLLLASGGESCVVLVKLVMVS